MKTDTYTCDKCKKTFRRSKIPIACMVLHVGGECCHYGDTEVMKTNTDSADEVGDLLGIHLSRWRGTPPLEDFANVDDVFRTLHPALEEFITAQLKSQRDELFREFEEQVIGADEQEEISQEQIPEAWHRNKLRQTQRQSLQALRSKYDNQLKDRSE